MPSLRFPSYRPGRVEIRDGLRASSDRAVYRCVALLWLSARIQVSTIDKCASRSELTVGIEENGTDPISGEALTKEDLIDVKASE